MLERNAVIVGGNRTPFVKAGTAYAQASNQDMLTAAIDGLVARFGLAGTKVDEVVAGAVLKHTRDFNLTRESVLGSALDPHTPAIDLQQACGTGLEAVIYAANKIRLGQATTAIAGGVDSASDAPIVVKEGLRRALLKASYARKPVDRIKAFAKVRPADLAPVPPAVVEPRTGLSMGESQAQTTQKWGISREDQDALTLASHQNLAKAWDSGFFDDLVTPFLKVAKDKILRPETTAAALAKLKPVFGGPEGTMTAGNSTALTDGAAVVLLAEESHARAQNWPVLARVVDAQVAASDYVTGNEDLLLAGARAIPELLERNGLTADDIDLFEIHEAFASTVLATLAALEQGGITIDRAKLNVNGSSLAAGHPFAATGGRIVATLAKMLAEKGPGSKGLISICAAGGMAVTAILEAV
ncbi:acetyl-CoA C-acetyltransferase [Propioniciclava sp. MC1595]|uniref:acetyl-CoA C-acetyltransferase n=1 Tax=Propioniciclava sp. MC1595 TaxID=2760308 RepID=UPI00166257BF|nr:acetyl-CoA C-acetyltransferase [Propioniciclava sp. MC1595]MBB1494486.1 acetyl-CoA C-acetyltransferase [Propioniciclava sp. MC1595]QTE27143.1 acetyl-CoA C-acetyltransferase [Propioniciclava sp. MC1595]